MVISQMAYNYLTPAAKARCDALIAVPLTNASSSTSNFITAAVWADDFKSQLGTAIWHYIDLPFSLDGTDTSGFVPASFDVVQAINLCVSNLASTATTETDKATALRYILHFVGDIQQPLHCSTAISAAHPNGDAGGNGFSLNGTYGNLHSLWDSGGGYVAAGLSRPLSASGMNTLSNKVFESKSDGLGSGRSKFGRDSVLRGYYRGVHAVQHVHKHGTVDNKATDGSGRASAGRFAEYGFND
jgi:S1/P1 Nuclease